MKKIPIEREKSDVRISSSEREEARPKVKILFLYGFFASGQCQPALALREAFEGRAKVISPDLPTHPKEALALIRDVIDRERPDVLVSNSCGSFHFPGAHTPTAEEMKTWYVPLVEKLMMEYPASKDGYRYFRHFKGGHYRYVHSAFDSETQERMVVYQALYGDGRYWVRPERMFFETVEHDGHRFVRFSEIDKE